MTQRNRSSVTLGLGAGCTLGCPVCACGRRPAATADAIGQALDSTADALILRDFDAADSDLAAIVGAARSQGLNVIARVGAAGVATAADLATLATIGVTAVRVPIFSHAAKVHDIVAERPGALAAALGTLQAATTAGLGAEIEIPLLQARLQDLDALLDRCLSAAGTLQRARLYLPTGTALPRSLHPPAWDAAAPRVAAFYERCSQAGVHAQIDGEDGIPLCALRDHSALWPLYHFHPKRAAAPLDHASFPTPCGSCAVRPQCTGVTAGYLAAHGGAGLTPWTARPRALYEQRTTPRPAWTEARRAAAANKELLVLRPTVNCNQDCPFCSANETSAAVWPDPTTMYRKIARAAQMGVRLLSFSGGEPALSKHLGSYVRVARRVGFERIELITNGTLLTEKRVRELADAGLSHAFVSLHAHTEAISQVQTRKVGDWPRTVAAIERLIAAGIGVQVNHVINSRNFRYLTRYVAFIHERFGGTVPISFAFITPQYLALEHFELVPQLSEVMPYLRQALHHAVEVGQPFVIGSRQGIPPCMLREFQAWSDIFDVANAAASEDAHQKIRAPTCDDCRMTEICTGLWRPYAARFGLDELRAIPGSVITGAKLKELHQDPWQVMRFSDVDPELRNPEAEAEYARSVAVTVPEVPAPAADSHALGRSRPLRVQLAGTGPRAAILARELLKVGGLAIDCVSSPHAPDGDLATFGHPPAYRDTAEGLDDLRPEALIIASSTASHLALIQAAVARGVPALIEKPLVASAAESAALRAVIDGYDGLLMPAHQVRYAAGIHALTWAPAHGDASVVYRAAIQRNSPDALRTWQPGPAFQGLYHALVLVGAAVGGGTCEVTAASASGQSAPERLTLSLRFPRGTAELSLDYTASAARLDVAVARAATDDVTWSRIGREITLTRGATTTPVERRGGEIALMLTAFRDGVVAPGVRATLPTIDEALDIQHNAAAAVAALADAEPRFRGELAVRHVSSKPFRRRVLG